MWPDDRPTRRDGAVLAPTATAVRAIGRTPGRSHGRMPARADHTLSVMPVRAGPGRSIAIGVVTVGGVVSIVGMFAAVGAHGGGEPVELRAGRPRRAAGLCARRTGRAGPADLADGTAVGRGRRRRHVVDRWTRRRGDRRRGRPADRSGGGGGVERSRLGTSRGPMGLSRHRPRRRRSMVVGGLLSLFAFDTPARTPALTGGSGPSPAASLVPDTSPLEDLS